VALVVVHGDNSVVDAPAELNEDWSAGTGPERTMPEP
jgi:hypothetical protein